MADGFHDLRHRLASNARAAVGRFIDGKITQFTGLHPIEQTLPDDIFVCGYPKSGNTWFQHLVTALLFGVDVRLAPDALINDLVPDVHFKRYYRRYLPATARQAP